MAFADTQTVSIAASNVLHFLARPFVAIGNFLVSVAEASTHAKALDELAQMTDAQLAAKGTTREAQVKYILRGYIHL